jgi:HEAT repeat protein
MNIKKNIAGAFNVQEGEGLATVLLLIHSFLIGVTLAFYFAPANALFIREFGIKMLPYAYIASGIIGYLTGYIYTRLQRKFALSKVFTGTLIFLLMMVSAIVVSFKLTSSKEVIFLLCLATVFSLSYLEFWGLALRMFNLRQGKRLFGLLSSGDIVSSIIGYLSIPAIIPLLHDTTDLLYFAVVGMLCSLVLLRIIIKKFPENLTASRASASVVRPQPLPFSKLFKERYFVLIFSVAAVSMIAAYFTDYFYLSLTRMRFETKEELTKFIGLFFAMVKVVELILSLISGRILKQYGMKLGITLLPLLVGGILLLAGITGAIFGATSSLFFIFIAFNKLIERSVRKAIDGASFRILYQPLAAEQQLDVQAKVEGIISHLAIIIAGVLLLLYSKIPGATLVHLSFIFLVIVALWLKRAFGLYENYRSMLKTTLEERSSSLRITKRIRSVHEYLLDVIERSSEQVGKSAKNLFEKLFPLPYKNSNFNKNIGSTNGHTVLQSDTLRTLAKSQSASDREKAALLLGEASRYQSFRLVQELLEDDSPAVKKAALLTAGKLKRSEFWHYLMEHLPSRMYGDSAASALSMAGLPILNDLERHFSRTGQSRITLSRIIHIFRNIGGKQAIQLLRSKLAHPDKEVRYEVLNALAEIEYHADKNEYLLLKQALEEEIGSIVWTLASIVDITISTSSNLLISALEWEFSQKKERLYVLLSLMYDAKTIGYIREIMENGSSSSRVYALEIIDITVPSEIKQLLLPLLEELPPVECISAFKFLYPQEELSIQDRLKDIIFKDHATVNRWTKACALRLLGDLGLQESCEVLMANTVNNDMLLAETAAYALRDIAPDKFENQFVDSQKMRSSGLKEKIDLAFLGKSMLLFDTVCFLKTVGHFENVVEADIVDIAELTRQIEVSAGKPVIFHAENTEFCYWILWGKIHAKSALNDIKEYTDGSFIGDIIGEDNIIDRFHYQTAENTQLLQINKYELYEPIANHIGIARSFVEKEF